jgi:heptosyltransferase-2
MAYQENVTRTASLFSIKISSNILAICPGAEFGEAKRWPAGHFAELANLALDQNWQVWIFGSGNDSLIAESILCDIDDKALDRVVNLVGRTNLAQAIDLMSLVSVVVSNDSGLMHVAAGLSKPLVGLYGSTSPHFTPPLAEKVKLFATNIECRPCFKRRCPYGHLLCLKEIKPEDVKEAVSSLSGS